MNRPYVSLFLCTISILFVSGTGLSRAATVPYETTFEGLDSGVLSPHPGTVEQDFWYHLGLLSEAYAAIAPAVGDPGQCLEIFASGDNPIFTQTYAIRDFTPADLTRTPLLTFSFDVLCSTSDVTSVNRYDAQVQVVDTTHPGYLMAGGAFIAGESGVPRDETGLDLVIVEYLDEVGHLPIPLTVGQDLTWDVYHAVEIVIDQSADHYVSLTVDGQTQDLTAYRLPRTLYEGQWLRGRYVNSVLGNLVTEKWGDPPVSTDDLLRLDNVRVQVEYTEGPAILAITDVGNDNGRQVRLQWVRSRYDSDEGPDIFAYDLYRRQDANKLEGWDYVMSVPAAGDEVYQCVAPTLCDSTAEGVCWSVFLLRAMTADPLEFYTSAPDSGYSVDNLAPELPGDFTVTYGAAGVDLAWSPCPSDDFRFFRIYRSQQTRDMIVVQETTDTAWFDPEGDWSHTYALAVVDHSGNESLAASPAEISEASDSPPRAYGLGQAVPNPFNPMTRLTLWGPRTGESVTLAVYDLAGRKVRTLLAGRLDTGPNEVVWDGRDDQGRLVPAGAYLARLVTPQGSRVRKLMLVD